MSRRAGLLLWIGLLLGPVSAEAGNLRDVVRNLYGGDGIELEPTPPPFPSHAPHFQASSLRGLDSLNSSLAASLGFLSLNSTVSGFTFDLERGVPVRTTESLGPLLSERADTLGARKLNLAYTFTQINFERFEGDELGGLLLRLAHDDSNMDGRLGPPPSAFEFELDEVLVDLELLLEQQIHALFATYGVLDDLDVGVVVPIVHVRVRANAAARIARNSSISSMVHNFGPSSDDPISRGGGREAGIGDVLLRSKYNFLRKHETAPDLALVGQIKLPTGDEKDLLGTGETNFAFLLVASKALGGFTPHLNVGYEVTTGPAELDNLRYLVGFDASPHRRVTFALDLIGRWEPEGDGIGDHVVDLAPGLKINVFRSLVLGTNFLVPLNRNEGLRPVFGWMVGLEYTFGAPE